MYGKVRNWAWRYNLEEAHVATPKQVFLDALHSLPDDATFEEIEYHLHVRARIEESVKAAAEGRVIPHEQVKLRLAEWRTRAQ